MPRADPRLAQPALPRRPGSGPGQSAAQLPGQRRRLLASVGLSQVAAFGGRGVLRPRSGPLPPRPPLPAPRGPGPAGGSRGALGSRGRPLRAAL